MISLNNNSVRSDIMACKPMFWHTFLAITQPFWANWAEIFCGNSGDYYLSIGKEKFKLPGLFSYFDFLVTFGGSGA